MKVINRYVNKNLSGAITKIAHVIYENKYYIVSDNGRETLIFPSDKDGVVTSTTEAGGEVGVDINYVLNNFSKEVTKE